MWNVLLLLLFAVLRVSECGSQIVGFRGQSVTLPCSYAIQYFGARAVCWGRGLLPMSGCKHLILNTDGHKVIEQTRLSSRYQLLGRLDQGDVSLTIQNLKDDDAGLYGCRVSISGWHNDEKHHIRLVINQGFTHCPTTSITVTTGSDVSGVRLTETTRTQEKWSPAARQDNCEHTVIANAVKLSFILMAVVVMAAVYGVWRCKHRPANQSEEENRSV